LNSQKAFRQRLVSISTADAHHQIVAIIRFVQQSVRLARYLIGNRVGGDCRIGCIENIADN